MNSIQIEDYEITLERINVGRCSNVGRAAIIERDGMIALALEKALSERAGKEDLIGAAKACDLIRDIISQLRKEKFRNI